MFNWLLSHFISWFWTAIGAFRGLGDAIITSVLSAVGVLIPSAGGGLASISTTISHINYFIPLSEIVALATTYAVLWVMILAYRIIKSWIPTVSGT